MAKTTNFGFNKFGSEGRISDEGHKFSLRDRDLFDSLLYALFTHDHQASASSQLEGFTSTTYPELTLSTTGGTIPANRNLYYRIAYRDSYGNETAGSIAALVSTPEALQAPGSMVLSTATTGGLLEPGTYKYALSYYQTGGGETTAPTINTILIPAGTSTNTVTITLDTLPDGADGWKIYRKAPADNEYYLLDTVASGATNYIDDGSVNPDCTKRRKTTNSTNSTNSVTIAIPAGELPLDQRVVSWRIYRTSTAGSYPTNSLVATVAETTTEGGADLVTSYTDTGAALSPGIPLSQTAVPPTVPQLDLSRVFDAAAGRLPSTLAPLGVHSHCTFLPGTLAVGTYNQFQPAWNMPVERIDAYFLTAPTGVDGSNYITIRLSDDSLVNEVQHIWNDSEVENEIQRVSNTATGGTFTLSDGIDTTSAIAYDATAATIETRLETDITSIVDVTVSGSGTSADPWVITYVDPGGQDVTELTANDASLTGGTTTITTSIPGSDGGTFTLSDGTDTTSAIAYDALAATIETRLETDITSITNVTVTGTGTSADPWVVEFVTPGGQEVDLLQADDASLNGVTTITEEVKGRGNTVIDLDVTAAQSNHAWQSSTTDAGTQEADEAPATGGSQVSDTLAGNDVAQELDAQLEACTWNIGTLEAGTYRFQFFVSDYDKTSTFALRVNDLNATTIVSSSHTPARSVYTPAYELVATLDGTEDIELEVEKTDTGTDRVRVDRFEYEVELPTLYAGQITTCEVLVTGSPTTNGDDVNLTIWY